MSEKFKVGDRVKYIYKQGDRRCINEIGTVVGRYDDDVLQVEFDNQVGENYSFGKDGYCWQTNEANWELVEVGKPPKPKKMTHLVVWDTTCGDPHELFPGLPEAKVKAGELLIRSDTIKDSVMIYEIKKTLKPRLTVTYSSK